MNMIDTWGDGWFVLTATTVMVAFFGGMNGLVEEADRTYWARYTLALIGGFVGAVVWPIAVPVALVAAGRWAWLHADIDYLPRSERKRIRRELANARADQVLNESLREMGYE